MQYPYIEVSQLAPSTSFYAALFHPLELRYLTAESATAGPGIATFGSIHGPVLDLRQVSNFAAVRLSSVRISAPSPAAIEAFYKQGIAANPASVFTAEKGFHQATMFDLDGNRIQVVCAETTHNPNVITGQFTLILEPTQAMQVSRVLGWNDYIPKGTELRNAGFCDKKNENIVSKPPDSTEQTHPEQAETGVLNSPNEGRISAVFGALLGVAAGAAAGAAITYGVMSARTPTTVPSRQEAIRTRVLPTDTQYSAATNVSTGLIDREHHKPHPVRLQRIKFEEVEPSTEKCSSSQPATSVPEKRAVPSGSDYIERGHGENTDTQVIRVSRDVEVSGRKHTSKASTSNPTKSTRTSRRFTLPPPENCESTANSKAIEKQKSEMKHETSISNKLHQSSSSSNHGHTPRRIAEHARNPSSISAKSCHSEKPPNERNLVKGKSKDTLRHKLSSGLLSERSWSDRQLPTTQFTETSRVSARNFPLPPSRAGTSEFLDTVSQVSARKTGLPASQVENSLTEDAHSHISARHFPLPPSQAGASEFLDTISQVSTRKTRLPSIHAENSRVRDGHVEDTHSHVSARHFPLPPSQAGTDIISNVSERNTILPTDHVKDSQSHISARHFPLPSSQAGIDIVSNVSERKTSRPGGHVKDTHSRVSARNFPLPPSQAGTDIVSNVSERKTSRPGGHVKDTHSRVSARNFPLPPSQAGTDILSNVSERKTNLPACQAENSRVEESHDEDIHSHVSARQYQLPPSRAGTSEFFDTVSHVSKRKTGMSTGQVEHSHIEDARSYVSARRIPLPASTVNGGRQARTSEFFDTVSHISKRTLGLPASQVENSRIEDTHSHVSARCIPLPASTVNGGPQVGASEFFDTVSHVSARRTGFPTSQTEISYIGGKRSHVSARNIPLPASTVNGRQASASEFFDTVSHVSARMTGLSTIQTKDRCIGDKRSYVSARNIPLPASRVSCDQQAGRRLSHISAREIPLPASFIGVNSDYGTPSRISARNVPLPGSYVGSSGTRWDDDAGSIAPSDSISNIGNKY